MLQASIRFLAGAFGSVGFSGEVMGVRGPVCMDLSLAETQRLGRLFVPFVKFPVVICDGWFCQGVLVWASSLTTGIWHISVL